MFDIGSELGGWVDKRIANAIAAAASPENLQKVATAVSAALQGFLASETDRAIAGAEAAAEKVIADLGAVLGVPVQSVINDLTGEVKQTGDGLSSEIGGVTAALGNLVGQIVSGLLADLPHLLTKLDPDAAPS